MVVKYVRAMSVDELIFSISLAEKKLYKYRQDAEEGKQPWEKVFKITIEEA
jgi:hypothetical protein